MEKFLCFCLVAMLAVGASHQQQLSPGPTNGQDAGNLLKFIGDLGPALASADMVSKLFGGSGSMAAPQDPGAASAGSGPSMTQVSMFASQLQSAISGTTPSPGTQLMNSLSNMLRSAQDTSSKAVSSTGETVASAAQMSQQNAANVAQSAQTGIQSALAEISQGLKQIANNNPSLIPDVKNLYNNVSAKLSSASSSVSQLAPGAGNSPIVPATNPDQLANNLAKVAAGQTS